MLVEWQRLVAHALVKRRVNKWSLPGSGERRSTQEGAGPGDNARLQEAPARDRVNCCILIGYWGYRALFFFHFHAEEVV